MHSKIKMILAGAALFISALYSGDVMARPSVSQELPAKDATPQAERIQKTFDVRKNTVSNIQFYTSNYGVFGMDVERGTGGGYWPRGSLNQYIYGGGIWFGAKKWFPNAAGVKEYRKYAVVSYDPSAGGSWLIPGRYEDYNGNVSATVDESEEGLWLNRTYMSTEFNRGEGTPNNVKEKYAWPIWDTDPVTEGYHLGYDRYFGRFVNNPADRNKTKHAKGPAFISEEDIFASFKDTDLSRYKIGPAAAKRAGYPLKLQFEQMIYSWGFGEYKDFVFIKYDIINMSDDSLRECWMSPMMDVDVARAPYTQTGADNDRVKYYKPANWDTDPKYKDTTNLAFQWTMNTQGEDGKGFGYLGYDFLESPSVYKADGIIDTIIEGKPAQLCWMWNRFANFKAGQKNPNNGTVLERDTVIGFGKAYFNKSEEGFIRHDKRYYETIEQLGLVSFRNWNIEQDKKNDQEWYDFMSEIGDNGYIRDGDFGPGDKRFMMATGPFSMRPKDTVRVVVGIILAQPAVRREADGSEEDVKNLLKRDRFAQQVYDNNFRAPAPPNNTVFLGQRAFNNAIEVYWDSTAEVSKDAEENGLDFLGYTLYRARDPYLDTFNINKIAGDEKYPKGRSPFGWKRIASWQITPPFEKSRYRAGTDPNNAAYPMINDFEIVGMAFDKGVMDTMSVTIMRTPLGLVVRDAARVNKGTPNAFPYATPIISDYVSTEDNPWSAYFAPLWKDQFKNLQIDPLKPYNTNIKNEVMLDSVIYGKITLNPALIAYNPLYWDSVTVPAVAVMKNKALLDAGNVVAYNDPATFLRVPFTPIQLDSSSFTTHLVSVTSGVDGGDTIRLYNTIRPIELNGEVKYFITKMVPRWDKANPDSWKAIFQNPAMLYAAKEKLMECIQNGLVLKMSFGNIEGDSLAKQKVIVPYMSKITKGRRYYDMGDDNGTGVVDLSDESTNTEKILNNIEYYYKLEAWDEGDFMQPTELKNNDGSVGRPNNMVAYAKAGRPEETTDFEIISVDEDKMGGLKNFRFFGIDPERVNQKLAGRTLELTINPQTSIQKITVPGQDSKYKMLSLYNRELVVKDHETGEELFRAVTPFDQNGTGLQSIMYAYSENGFSVVMADSIIKNTIITTDSTDFGTHLSNESFVRTGTFTTGKFNVEGYPYSYNFTNGYENTFGFSFDFAFEQHGGVIRAANIEKKDLPNVTTIVSPVNIDEVKWKEIDLKSHLGTEMYAGSQVVALEDTGYEKFTNDDDVDPNSKLFAYLPYLTNVVKQYNTGAGDYLITFKEGGTENMTVTYNNVDSPNSPSTASFSVPYLTYEVKNTHSFNALMNDDQNHNIKYGFNYELMTVPDSLRFPSHITRDSEGKWMIVDPYTSPYPHPKNLGKDADKFMGKYTSFSCGYVNLRSEKKSNRAAMKNAAAVDKNKKFREELPNIIGQQGRYYLSAFSNGDTLDFANAINISGATYVFDYLQRGYLGPDKAYVNTLTLPQRTFGADFKAGDQVVATVKGGCFGMPITGAKVLVKVKATNVADNNYSKGQLEKIKVVPNPYYLTHEAQKSAYDTKLYFTKLPAKCKIDIYTATGDLVRSINHEELGNSEYNDYKYALDVWDLYSSNAQRVQSQTFVAVITTPNGEQAPIKFTVLVGSTRLIAD